jgi:demethoxyubiquinone hydroxylase (CLK1/Coq7/Cat5 family)
LLAIPHTDPLGKMLRRAYSGELAAAHAYRGHWQSLDNEPERTLVRRIEEEEWEHRRQLAPLMSIVGATPSALRETVFWAIGRTLSASCRFSGRLLPMYFAGWLENRNVTEYKVAASHAADLGLDKLASELGRIAAVEAQHELFFKNAVAGHLMLPCLRAIFHWG